MPIQTDHQALSNKNLQRDFQNSSEIAHFFTLLYGALSANLIKELSCRRGSRGSGSRSWKAHSQNIYKQKSCKKRKNCYIGKWGTPPQRSLTTERPTGWMIRHRQDRRTQKPARAMRRRLETGGRNGIRSKRQESQVNNAPQENYAFSQLIIPQME